MSGLGVIHSLGASLDVTAHTVVIAGSKSLQVVKTVNGDSVFRRVVTKSSSITSNVALSDVVSSLSTNKETITAQNGVGNESGALQSFENVNFGSLSVDKRADLENVKGSTGMETRLLVDRVDDSGLVALLRGQSSVEVDFKALGDLVLNLDLVAKDVGGGPGLGEGQTVSLVGKLGLNVAVDDVRL